MNTQPMGLSRCIRLALSGWILAAGVWNSNSAEFPVAELVTFKAGDAGWHMGSMGLAQLDRDAAWELVIPHRDASGSWHLEARNVDGSSVPGFPFSAQGAEINTSPLIADLDGDGLDEIIITCGTQVLALRSNGSILWQNQVNRSTYTPSSGFMTPTNGFYWSKTGGWLNQLPSTASFSSQVSAPMLADINSDGILEILTAWKIDPDLQSGDQDFNPLINDIWGSGEWGTMGETWSGGVVAHQARSGARQYVYHLPQLVESGLAVGQVDLDAAGEVFVLNDSDSVVAFDSTQPHGLFGNGTLHKQFGKNQRLITGTYQLGVELHAADIDGDGRDEVLVPASRNRPSRLPSDTILDDDGTILWRRWTSTQTYPVDAWQNNAAMIPLNPNRDQHVDVFTFAHTHEISYRFWDGVELVNHPGWPKSFYPEVPTPPVVGDLNGDGREEIVIGTFTPGLQPSSGSLFVYDAAGQLLQRIPAEGGIKQIPLLGDMNQDGVTDVLYRTQKGHVVIQSFGPSGGRQSWPMHRGNSHRTGHSPLPLYPEGTPMVFEKQAGLNKAQFSWISTSSQPVKTWQIWRTEGRDNSWSHLATLEPHRSQFTDGPLLPGNLYRYEVVAVYADRQVPSAPFAVVPQLNGNLVGNAGFEENENARWDKWYNPVGETNMSATASTAWEGHRSMEIKLNNQSSGPTISQGNQYGVMDPSILVRPGKLYSFGGFIRTSGLTKPSAHWLEWISTKTAENTNNRPSLPFPNYFTPSFQAGAASSEWVYLNRTFLMPSGFPNVELLHRFHTAEPTSGSIFLDHVFYRELPDLASTNWVSLIPLSSSWKWSSSTPPADWDSPSYSDAGWSAGLARFGAGSGPQNITTVLPPRKPAYYFRKKFSVPAGRFSELLLAATCTEGGPQDLEITLNGYRIPASAIEAVTGPGNAIQYYDLAPFLEALQPGENLMAVKMNNVFASDWDDVAFDVQLKTVRELQVQPGTLSIKPAANQKIRLEVAGAPGTLWQLERAPAVTGPWSIWQDGVALSDGPLFLEDSSIAESAHFYRMVPGR